MGEESSLVRHLTGADKGGKTRKGAVVDDIS